VYAYSKFLFDQIVRRRWHKRNAQIVGLRYFNVYGPREQHKGRMASVAFHFFNQYRAEGKVKLFEGCDGYANGGQLRDFVSVEDVVKVNMYFLDNPHKSGIFNLGTGQAQSFNDVAAATINALRNAEGKSALSLAELQQQGLIEYTPFPEALRGKYQSYTQADIGALRNAGYAEPFMTVEQVWQSMWSRCLKQQDDMYPSIEDFVGNTPLVRLKRIPGNTSNVILAKLEGNNPAGSVKDRPALSMIMHAEARGEIKPGDTLIEATSGNTGIALAMAAAVRGYKMILVMPDNQSMERRQTMHAYGAELVLTSKEGSMELARDTAGKLRAEGRGIILDQFANPDNPLAHYEGTAPEIWRDTQGRLTHFVSSMGTTGTIMGCSRFFKEKTQLSGSSACSPKKARRFPASANGRKPTCRKSTTAKMWTAWNT